MITSLSGLWRRGGAATRRGYNLWAKLVNLRGGIRIGRNRYRVRLFYVDDRSDPVWAERAVRSLLQEHTVDVILGPYASEIALAIAPWAEEHWCPHVTGSAEALELYQQGFQWTFGTLASNVFAVQAMIRLLRRVQEAEGLYTAAILGSDDVFSRTTAQLFRDSAEEDLRLKIQMYELYPRETREFLPWVRRVRAQAPELFMVSGHVDNLIGVARAVQALSWQPNVFVMHYGVGTQDFIEALRKDAKHIVGVSQWSPDLEHCDPVLGSSRDFLRHFRVWYGRIPDHTEVGCATAGSVLQQAIERVALRPPLDPEARATLCQELASSEFRTLFGSIRLSHAP